MLDGHGAMLGPGPAQPGAFPWAELICRAGTLAVRPAAGWWNKGMLYLATDTSTLYRSNGTSWEQVAGGDHGALTGLGDDDHSQYALLAGRSGGQTLYGGTSGNENMTIRSNSDIHGDLILQNNGGRVVIGGGANATQLVLKEASGSGTNVTGFVAPALAADVVYTLPTADGTNGQVLTTNGSTVLSWTTISGGTAATQAEQEAGTSTTVFTSPGRQQFHPSAAKAWVSFNGTGTPAVNASYNLDASTPLVDQNTGYWSINIGTDFSSNNYCAAGIVRRGTAGTTSCAIINIRSASSMKLAGALHITCNTITPAAVDCEDVCVAMWGDQ